MATNANKVAAVKIRRGLYRLDGVVCGCGGEIRAESVMDDGRPVSRERAFRWECFCTKCRQCDIGGWPTLAACVREAATSWRPT